MDGDVCSEKLSHQKLVWEVCVCVCVCVCTHPQTRDTGKDLKSSVLVGRVMPPRDVNVVWCIIRQNNKR